MEPKQRTNMNLLEKYLKLKESIEPSEHFKKWFGKSVLHDNGIPHTFYHGTGSDIHTFSHDFIGKGNDSHGSGFYFTNKPDVASDYATPHDTTNKSPNVIPVHLKVVKPIIQDTNKEFSREHIRRLIVSAPDHHDNLNNFGDVSHEGYNKVLNAAVDGYSGIPKMNALHSLHNDFYNGHASELLKNITSITGHDGVIAKNGDHTIVNVFHPNQIKSKIGNNGNYSKKSNNITEENT